MGRHTPDEPNASILRDVLEGYASGHFDSTTEIRRYLETFPSTRRWKHKALSLQTVFNILRSPIYAGYISIPKWNIHLHPGKHEALISFAIWQKIQDRL